MEEINHEFVTELQKSISGEIKTDPITRVLFSTDASIHKIEPLGVVFPRNTDELIPIVRLCNQYHIPIIPRGSGSGLAGQAIGRGLIVDCSRYLDQLIQINAEERTAIVEPGVILDDLNRITSEYGLEFGPDPASSERATLGGCIGNNAAGAHSIQFGMTADHIISADVVLSDGSISTFRSITLEAAKQIVEGVKQSTGSDLEKRIYHAAFRVRDEYQEDIQRAWPHTWRRVSGYNLNYLIPWSSAIPSQWDTSQLPYPPILPNTINLAPLLAGSEGTLGIIKNTTLRLVPIKKHSILAVINFSSISEACDWVTNILELAPSAVELIPQSLIHLARSVPAYASLLSFVTGDPAALLVVEFSGDDPQYLLRQLSRLNSLGHWSSKIYIAESDDQQKQVWQVRKVGLGILMGRLGDSKPISFIEDMSVPVDRLGEFIQQMEMILKDRHTQADYYGHASAGCLHIRPLVNLKTPDGRVELRTIAEAAVDLVLKLGGAVSAEHGDGITRGEWIERAYGPRIKKAFHLLKQAADPSGILNPGKIVDPPKMDSDLRYDTHYNPVGWTPVMAFSSHGADANDMVLAIEQCNGAGVCRKSTGVMCPSFQATKNELFSTRGRGNLLRALVSNEFDTQELALQAVKETLELCLACKGCKAECPSSVDIAKLRYEFFQHYYSLPGNHHPIRDYIFGYIDRFARFARFFSPFSNYILSTPLLAGLRERMIGLSRKRTLPKVSRKSLHDLVKEYFKDSDPYECILLIDTFTEYFFPETGMDALKVLQAVGCKVKLLSIIGAGRTLISKGFLKQAKQHAKRLMDEISAIDPEGKLPVIGLEPSEIYTLRDEFLDLFPGDEFVTSLARRVYMIDEYLIRPDDGGSLRIENLSQRAVASDTRTHVLLHGHCYQKAQPPAKDGYPTGVLASSAMLENAGYAVAIIDNGCCGMAGAFGYEAEHYTLSMQVAELALFPAINRDKEAILAAAGISCQTQIEDATGRHAFHPISLVARLLSSLPIDGGDIC
jgi:FAD/FMN-containing dehydrogenase/Fe-S oxidoreductase